MKARKAIPGPGQYNADSEVLRRHEPSFKVGTQTREDIIFLKSIKDKPAPGDYNPNESFTKTSNAAWKIG